MGTVRIPLHSRKYPGLYAIVDEEDAELVSQFRWRPYKSRYGHDLFYAFTNRRMDTRLTDNMLMHRLVMGLSKHDPDVDHVDGDGLNNSKSNLRTCTVSQNQANRHTLRADKSSVFRGVTWHKQISKWQAQVKVNGRSLYLGCFESEVDAAIAYNKAALQHFGEFARLNDVESA